MGAAISFSEARQAQELLGKGGVIGKIMLVPDGSDFKTGVKQSGIKYQGHLSTTNRIRQFIVHC